MEQGSNTKKNIKMKDILRLFFKYEIDSLPVLDKKSSFKGLINKDTIIQDATNGGFIDKPFSKSINKYLFYPDEEKFLVFVSSLSEKFKFPVVDAKGEFLFLWDKIKLLNSYYNLYSKDKEIDISGDMFYKAILNVLPFNILLTDSKNSVIFANDNFLKNFDFEKAVLLDHRLSGFFPSINKILTKQNFFPNIFSIMYRHLKWYYTILKCETTFIYIFSLTDEKLKIHNTDFLFSADSVEIRSRRRKNHKHENKQKAKSLPTIIEDQETDIIRKVLTENDWNITRAARILNIPRQTLQYKISKYKII